MVVAVRTALTPAEVDEVWSRWRSGQAVKVLSREMRRHPTTVRDLLKRCGGIRPRPRTRPPLRLSLGEREEISRGLAAGLSLRAIATGLGRAPSTVSREVERAGGRDADRALDADAAAWAAACRPKQCKLAAHPRLRAVVQDRLREDFSPEQVAGWLVRQFPDEPEMRVSHETINRSLFVQSRGALKKELTQHLRTRRAMRRPAGKRLPDGRGNRLHELTISDRPAEVEDRAVPGHWEGDLVFGRGMSPVATLVERSTRFVMLVALPEGHKSELVVDALAAKIQTLPAALAKTLTWDQGNEMSLHARFTVATGVQVYFCDPKSPWQRGSNENTNGLLRQYLPRTLNFRTLTQADFDAIADKLNTRPRQTLGFRTPSEALDEVLR
ncbi:IS30 family transposase [Motilibacter peucedani]|uniref:IS30 family transposase n=1 Tax=Motilibacter peucedani TaxID=598650 RepID=UPI000EB14A27|nr:IS30 family transposase [Motilibacter peucedani]